MKTLIMVSSLSANNDIRTQMISKVLIQSELKAKQYSSEEKYVKAINVINFLVMRKLLHIHLIRLITIKMNTGQILLKLFLKVLVIVKVLQ